MPVNHHTGSAAPDDGSYRRRPTSSSCSRCRGSRTGRSISSSAARSNATPACSWCSPSRAPLGARRADQARLLLRPHGQRRRLARTGLGSCGVERCLKPSEYWARQCHVGASFIRPHEVTSAARSVSIASCGAATTRTRNRARRTREAIARRVRGRAPRRSRTHARWQRGRLYGFDLDALAPFAAQFGPLVSDTDHPLQPGELPIEAYKCPAFAGQPARVA